MGIWNQLSLSLKDVRHFGPSVIARHVTRLGRSRLFPVSIGGGRKLVIRQGDSDLASVRQVFLDREYDLQGPAFDRLAGHYRALLAAGKKPIILDAGANIGCASVWFHQRFPEAHIVAIEPDPHTAEILRLNLAEIPHHTVIEAALGSTAGRATVLNEGSSWGVKVERSDQGVAVVTVDEAFDLSGGDTAFLVKIDIEGFENDLFASNLGWLEKPFAVIIELHDWLFPGKLTSLSFQRAIAAHEFEVFVKGENSFYVRV